MSAVSDDASDERLLASTRVEPAGFGAFYRRHEGQVLGYFLARAGDPLVAADLTAETFASALASVHRFRPRRISAAAWLFGIARSKLAVSCRRGRVEDRARRRLGMAPLVLTDGAVERIAAHDRTVWALVDELPGDQQDGVRARVIDERDYGEIAKDLRCSEAVVRQARTPRAGDAASPPGGEALTRIPGLEPELVAAAARLRTRRRLARPAARAAAAIVAVVVLMVVVVTAQDDADRRSRPAVAPPSQPNANQDTVPTPPLETQEMKRRAVQTANKWAREFAAPGALRAACTWSRPTCRMVCQRWGRLRPIPNCTPPSRAFRRSFRGATVQEIAINGDRAAARFSNGVTVELFGVTEEDRWVIDKFGENAGRGFFK